METPKFKFNILTFMGNHKCLRSKKCEIFCQESEACLRMDLTVQDISDDMEKQAKYLLALDMKVGNNYYYENELLSNNKIEAIKSVRYLCDTGYLSASVKTNGIVILDDDDDHDLGYYETVLYDCHITEDNKVVFDRHIKHVIFDTYDDALEYALTVNRF